MKRNFAQSMPIEESAETTVFLKEYYPPRLEKLGDLRSLTLGVSGGTGESGNSLTHFNAGSGFDFPIIPTP